MTLAFLYAGQGSQKPGMGQDFYEIFPQVRPFYDTPVGGLDLRRLSFGGSADELALTEHTQPSMAAFGAAVTLLLGEEGIRPQYAAGLSLGEYGALHAAGVFDAKSYIELLALRGRTMADAAAGIDSGMTAVLGLGAAEAKRAVEGIGGNVWVCNYNCPGQIVIGGEAPDVDAAAAKCLQLGAKRCVPLKVSGPFHTPLMEPAAKALRMRFEANPPGDMSIPVVYNAVGGLLPIGETIAHMLELQVKSPVMFEQSVRFLADSGVDTAIEIGPGNVLSGFVKKIAPDMKICSIEDVEGFYRAVDMARGGNL